MSHGLGTIDAFQALLPEWSIPVVEAVTRLGDVWFVFLLLPPLYWFGPARGWLADREDAGVLVGVVFGAMALTVALKTLFAVPRPPESLHLVAADGYGFPSGHALGATAVYGGAALLLDRWPRRRRYVVGGVLVVAIGLSRVALGVHHLLDVLAGFAVGLALLGVAGAVRRPGRLRASSFVWFAAVVGVASVVIVVARTGGVSEDAAMAFGGTLGAALAWTWLDRRHVGGAAGRLGTGAAAPATHRVGVPTAVAALVVLGGLFGAVTALEPPLPVAALANVLVFAGIVGLPGVQARLDA